jgi:hypothetical protein
MVWKEIKTWATLKGYNAKRTSEGYAWEKVSAPQHNGISKSVSKLATDIFNDMTGNKFLDYQRLYKENNNER